MAMCNYRLCDVCGQKAFYDADLNYESDGSLDYLGDWAVICAECAKTHQCMVVLREPADEGGRPIECASPTQHEEK